MHLFAVDANHGFAQTARDFGDDFRVSLSSRWTIARALFAGSPDLKIPEPTKTPSMPSCIINAASERERLPPAAKFTVGNRPNFFEALLIVRRSESLSRTQTLRLRPWLVIVECLPLLLCSVSLLQLRSQFPLHLFVRIIEHPSAMRLNASPKSRTRDNTGTLNLCLLM